MTAVTLPHFVWCSIQLNVDQQSFEKRRADCYQQTSHTPPSLVSDVDGCIQDATSVLKHKRFLKPLCPLWATIATWC